MAADGRSFGISLGINFAILTGCILFFGMFRKAPFTRKFYAPRRYMKTNRRKPHRLPTGFWSWFLPVYRTTEEEVIEVAGMDACMYMRIMSFGRELFMLVSLWVLITCLPTNLSGNEVNRLLSPDDTKIKDERFIYWVSPPPPVGAPPAPAAPSIDTPIFFNTSIPDPPPGLKWWKYNNDVPPLPPVSKILGDAYRQYVWIYDQTYRASSYAFSNLDLVTLSNIGPGSPKLWVHVIAVWFISLYCYRLLWRYSQEAVHLRIRYLTHVKKGAESHSIVVFDIPGLYAGTVRERLEDLAFFLPDKAKQPLRNAVDRAFQIADKGAATINKASTAVLGESFAAGAAVPKPKLAHMDTMHDIYFDADPGDDLEAPPLQKDIDSPPTSPGNVKPGYVKQFSGPIPEANRPPKKYKAYESVTEGDAWSKAEMMLQHGMAPSEFVEKEFDELYPNSVDAVNLVYDTSELDKLLREYNSIKESLQNLLDIYTSQKRRHKKIIRKQVSVLPLKYGAWGKATYGTAISVKVDALEFYIARMTELRRLILLKQVETKQDAKEHVNPTAFVTFKTRKMQVVASSVMQHHDVQFWRAFTAPNPNEIIWPNLGLRSWEKLLRNMLGWGAFAVMTLFYLIPVALIQGLLQVQKLAGVKGLGVIVEIPFIAALLTALLPGLVLTIFLALVPTIIKFLNIMCGYVTKSAIDFGVVRKYFIFQVLIVFFGNFIAGTLLNQIQQFIADPASIISVLGTAAPLTSIFFLNYIELQALSVGPIGLLRIPQFAIFWLRSQLASTERSKAKCWQDQVFEYGPMVPRHTMVILFGLVFAVINPLVPPMALLYFLVITIIEKYSMLYIYTEQFQSGGQLWRQIFEQIVASLLIFQIIMVFLLLIKKNFAAAIVVALVVGLSFIFRAACLTLFERPLQVLSIRAATDMDEADRTGEITDKELEEASRIYLSPAFQFDEATFEDLKAETEHMNAVLQGIQVLHAEVSKSDISPHDSDGEDTPRRTSTARQGLSGAEKPRSAQEIV
eukprot:jgi/Botrbrau1/19049/Bobra.0100s0073.2